jgi:bacitracin transport system ATP-binding protein
MKRSCSRIGCLIESPGFYPNLTATENLRIFATLRGMPNRNAIKNALHLVGLPINPKSCFLNIRLE